MFHVSLFKKYIGDSPTTSTELPPIGEEGVVILEPDSIVGTRLVEQGGKFTEQSLVKWKRLPLEEATCEGTTFLQQQFLNMTLEDKGPLRRAGIDRAREPRRSCDMLNKECLNAKEKGLEQYSTRANSWSTSSTIIGGFIALVC